MSFTNAAAAGLLNRFFNNTSIFDTATSLFLAASTTAPAEDGTGLTEPVGNGYARVAIPNTSFNAATNADPSVVTNSTEIAFPQASGGAFGNITHVAVMSASTGGTVYNVAALTAARQINDGDTLRFVAGDLSFTLD